MGNASSSVKTHVNWHQDKKQLLLNRNCNSLCMIFLLMQLSCLNLNLGYHHIDNKVSTCTNHCGIILCGDGQNLLKCFGLSFSLSKQILRHERNVTNNHTSAAATKAAACSNSNSSSWKASAERRRRQPGAWRAARKPMGSQSNRN